MITAALNGELDHVDYVSHPVFGVSMPVTCPNVPDDLLIPRKAWADKAAYDAKAKELAKAFMENFKKFEDGTAKEITDAGPKV